MSIQVKVYTGERGATMRIAGLESVLSEYKLTIPTFQRPFAWEDTNFEELREQQSIRKY